MPEIPKTYEPPTIEPKWYAFWESHGCFAADPARVSEKRPAYSIVIPPPNVTGVLTLGHVLNNTIQDILARRARMLGKEVLWLPGTDHAGIATQNVVEKTLKKEGVIKHRDDLGREALVAKIWEWREKYGGIILQQLRALGASCDWARTRFTMDAPYSECVSRVFVDLYKKGLIYRGRRMVNWCPASLTALSDEEVVMKEQNGTLYYFQVEATPPSLPGVAAAPAPRSGAGSGEGAASTFLTIATTRPETIPGDTAIAVNPRDPRYAHLIGGTARRPLPRENQALIPIIGDDAVVFDFGTGVLKVTPAHDKADFEIGQRHGLPQLDIMHPHGVMNDLAGADLAGLERFAARKKAVELLTELGALEKEEPYKNNVGYSERADVPIEPRLSDQWFLKYPSVPAATACVSGSVSGRVGVPPADSGILPESSRTRGIGESGETPTLPGTMRFFPERWAKVYEHWMAGIQDWCISRQLWWGHRIPVWYRKPAGPSESPAGQASTASGQASALKRHSLTQPGHSVTQGGHSVTQGGHSVTQSGHSVTQGGHSVTQGGHSVTQGGHSVTQGGHSPTQTSDEALSGQNDPAPAQSERVPFPNGDIYCGIEPPPDPEHWEQDPDVLDTWFSSWLWPFATMGWPEKTDTLAKFYPTTDLVTGPDIIFFWVARMIMAGYEWMGELPFRNVYFTGIIRDKQGRKMSKSLGNSPDPLDLIAKYGADALRFGVMRSAPLGADVMFDEKNVELGRNFCTKLWNAARFRQMQGGSGAPPLEGERGAPPPFEAEIAPRLLTADDRWILMKLHAAIRDVSTALDEYRFSDATAALYRFFWSEFCDWYLEAIKAALYGDDAALKANTLAVFDFVFAHTLRLFHPFLPFITEELWQGMGFVADLPADQGGTTIMTALWPRPLSDDEWHYFDLDPSASERAQERYDTVTAGRALRRDFNLPSSKRYRFLLRADLPAHDRAVVQLLLNADPLELVPHDWPAPQGTPSVLTPLGELFLPLEGHIDVAAERERLGKEIAKVEQEIAKVRAKLADENFTAKVPATVLDEHRLREESWAEKLAHLTKMRAALGA